jgi:hypothetical protein
VNPEQDVPQDDALHVPEQQLPEQQAVSDEQL